MTVTNRHGSITINDLELSGTLLVFIMLGSQGVDLQYKHLSTFCVNISSVVWAYKLRNSKSAVAGFLLRFLSIQIHQAEFSSMIPHHIAGEDNIMADIISRSFKTGKYFNASNDLVSYFTINFPLIKNKSWHECKVPISPLSCGIACLCGKLLTMASLIRKTQTGKNIGSTGKNMRPQQKLTLSSTNPYLPSNVTSSQENLLLGSGQGGTEEEIISRCQESRMPLRPSQRPLSWLENPVSSTGLKNNTNST